MYTDLYSIVLFVVLPRSSCTAHKQYLFMAAAHEVVEEVVQFCYTGLGDGFTTLICFPTLSGRKER